MTAAEREELIINHLPHVHWVAARIYDKLSWMVNFEDLVSIGVVGLIAAVDRYNPDMGVRLQTYADFKIRGAMLDSIRTSDGIAARQRQAAKRLRAAMESVEQRLCAPADEEATAQELGLTLEEYRKAAEKVRPIQIRSLDAYSQVGDQTVCLGDTLADGEDSQPSYRLERAELRELVKSGIQSLPQVQQQVIRNYFFRGQPLRTIADELGVHVTRASQIKIEAVGKLRAYVMRRWSGKESGRGKRQGTLVAC